MEWTILGNKIKNFRKSNKITQQELADKLEAMSTREDALKDVVVTICCSCDYFEKLTLIYILLLNYRIL